MGYYKRDLSNFITHIREKSYELYQNSSINSLLKFWMPRYTMVLSLWGCAKLGQQGE